VYPAQAAARSRQEADQRRPTRAEYRNSRRMQNLHYSASGTEDNSLPIPLFLDTSTASRAECIIRAERRGAIHANSSCPLSRAIMSRRCYDSATPRAELVTWQHLLPARRARPAGAKEARDPRAHPFPARRPRTCRRRRTRRRNRRRHWRRRGNGHRGPARVVPRPVLLAGKKVALYRAHGVPQAL
jgi:hypothetical protein